MLTGARVGVATSLAHCPIAFSRVSSRRRTSRLSVGKKKNPADRINRPRKSRESTVFRVFHLASSFLRVCRLRCAAMRTAPFKRTNGRPPMRTDGLRVTVNLHKFADKDNSHCAPSPLLHPVAPNRSLRVQSKRPSTSNGSPYPSHPRIPIRRLARRGRWRWRWRWRWWWWRRRRRREWIGDAADRKVGLGGRRGSIGEWRGKGDPHRVGNAHNARPLSNINITMRGG